MTKIRIHLIQRIAIQFNRYTLVMIMKLIAIGAQLNVVLNSNYSL